MVSAVVLFKQVGAIYAGSPGEPVNPAQGQLPNERLSTSGIKPYHAPRSPVVLSYRP